MEELEGQAERMFREKPPNLFGQACRTAWRLGNVCLEERATLDTPS